MPGDQVNISRVHDLRDDGQAGLFAGSGEDVQRLLTVSAEGVGAGPRLEGAAAQDVAARRFHGAGALHHVFFAVHGARAGHEADAAVADREVADLDDGVVSVNFAAGQLEWLADADDGVDALNAAELIDQLRVDVAEDGDDCPLVAVDAVVLEPEFADCLLDVRYLLFG